MVDNVKQFCMTSENKALVEHILTDAAYILQRNCKALTNKKYNAIPFYTEQDVCRMLNKTKTYEENTIHKLNDYVSFQFLPSGHIVGATCIVLYIKTPTGQTKKIVYTGDMSSPNNKQPFCKQQTLVSKANVIITEATYSDLNRCYKKQDIELEREQMKKDIIEELKKGNSILFPAFAMARSQSLLFWLFDNFHNDESFKTPIYLDGKLSLMINDTYREILEGEDKVKFEEVLSWDKLHYVKSYEDSVNLALRKDLQHITISSNGMCQVGRITSHLKANVENEKFTIMFIGYCAESTIGNILKNPKFDTVKIEGLEYKKKCNIYEYKTWSSHIQGDELIKWFKGISADKIIIHHSDDSKYRFRDIAQEELMKCNKTTPIVCADDNNNIFFV